MRFSAYLNSKDWQMNKKKSPIYQQAYRQQMKHSEKQLNMKRIVYTDVNDKFKMKIEVRAEKFIIHPQSDIIEMMKMEKTTAVEQRVNRIYLECLSYELYNSKLLPEPTLDSNPLPF